MQRLTRFTQVLLLAAAFIAAAMCTAGALGFTGWSVISLIRDVSVLHALVLMGAVLLVAATGIGMVLVFDKLIKKAAEPIPSSARSS